MVENPSSSDEGAPTEPGPTAPASGSGTPARGATPPANDSGTFDSESATRTFTPIEPIPPFADVVASTRVRSERPARVGRPPRGVRNGFFDLRPGPVEPPARHPLARHPLAAGARPRSIGQRLAQSVRPRPGGGRRTREARRRWAKAGLVTAVVFVLAVVAVPVAVLSWRSALGAEPNSVSVLGAGLALVGLALLAGGLIGLIVAGRSADPAPPASFAALLLGRPGALLMAIGVALLLCAALAAG